MLYSIVLVQDHPLGITASKTSKVSHRSIHEYSTVYKPVDAIYDIANEEKGDKATS